MTDAIRVASTEDDYVAFAGLVREYVEWCRTRYRDEPWFVGEVFGHQSLDTELGALATLYGPPAGRVLLATRDGEVIAGGAWRRQPDGSCEMKRLFVPPRSAGRGIGRRLAHALVASARDAGLPAMRLDTAKRFTEAIALYRSLGFRDREPYHDYPEALMPQLVFMELALAR